MKYLYLFVFSGLILNADTLATQNLNQKLSLLSKQVREAKDPDIKISYDPFYPAGGKRDIKNIENKNTKKDLPIKRTEKKKPYLTMILNKKAFIDGRWYKENEKISDFLIYKIDQDAVFLKKRNKIIKLKLSKPKSMLVTKEDLQ